MSRNFKLILAAEIAIAAVVVIALLANANAPKAQAPKTTPTATQQTNLVAGCEGQVTARKISQTWSSAPELNLEDKRKFWNLETNCGRVVVEVARDEAPITVNSLRFLTDQKYYDATPCHRMTTAGFFVLQCGDPSGTGRGGAGYQLIEENLPEIGGVNYPAGTVAIANSGQPSTSGAQFFIVYKDTTLAPDYTIVGRVVEGLEVIESVAAAGNLNNARDGAPKQNIGIVSAEFLSKKP